MKWITSKDLKDWASDRDRQETLPHMIRKLIRSSTLKIRTMRFPSGDNVHLTGWDGVLECSEATDFFPAGISLWEIGSDKDYKNKANKDYEKRAKDPKGYNPLFSTFIFVTPFIWNEKKKWIDAKLKDGIWQDVRIIDGQTLEEWLEISPTVSYWLASTHLMKVPTTEVQSVEEFWKEWAVFPEGLTLNKEILLGGREKEVATLLDQLSGKPRMIPVQSISRDESLAFIVASFQNNPELEEDLIARSIIVYSPDSFRKLMASPRPLILLPCFDDYTVIYGAIGNGHQVIVPLGIDASKQWTNIIVLPRIDRNKFVESLVTSGLTQERARKYLKESTRNITVLRRQLKIDKNIPQWAKGENIGDIIPALLCGRWDENSSGDKAIVAEFAKQPYERYIERLRKWLNAQDSPIMNFGTEWRIISPLDAWTHSMSFLTTQDLILFDSLTSKVLSEVDPILHLPVGERHSLSRPRQGRLYSRILREGMAQSLVLIAVYGDSFHINFSGNAQQFIDAVVGRLLNKSDATYWKSLDDIIPLLAEASPDVFLDTVARLSNIEKSPILALFDEEEGLFDTYSYYTGLLWALERVAWLENSLTKATVLLGRLAENDPGGHLNNRPINSLASIFKSWFPQTLSDSQGRIAALSRLLKIYPDTGLKLLLRLLPVDRDVAFPTNQFRWRLFDENFEKPHTWNEINQFRSDILDLILLNISNGEEDLASLTHQLPSLPIQNRDKVLAYISKNFSRMKIIKHLVWNELRKILGHHRSYPRAAWALPEAELGKIERLYLKFYPKNLLDQILWLFNEYPEFAEGFPDKAYSREKEEKVKQARIDGLKKIYQHYGLKKIIDIIDSIKEYQAFGQALAYVIKDKSRVMQFLELIRLKGQNYRVIVQSFLWQKSNDDGILHTFNLIKKVDRRNFSNDELSLLFLALGFRKEVWDEIEKYNEEVGKIYWKNCWVTFHWASEDDLRFVIPKLMDAGRYPSLITEMSLYIEKFNFDVIIEVLERATRFKSEDRIQVQYYDYERLFRKLFENEEKDVPRIMRLEWAYMPILTHFGDGIRPKYLERELAANPDFFVQILCMVYKPDILEDNVSPSTEEKDKNQALQVKNAFELLYYWKTIPGLQSDGTINFELLKEWIYEVRKRSTENKRLSSADVEIGKLLSVFSIDDPDYPNPVICEIVEDINTDEIKQGFYTGLYNKRGVSTRGVFDGGDQERTLMESYQTLSDKTALSYPVISSIFRRLAQEYEREAKREDNMALHNDLEG